MAFVSSLFLSLLLCASLAANAHVALPPAEAPRPAHHHHHHHHHPSPAPVHPPVKPPTKPPVHPPVKPPTKAPAHPPVKPPTKAPVHPPVKPPTKAPVHPPVYPPVKPPTKPPVMRKKVAVQGVVYCKACKYRGINTLLNATALSGAVVHLQCNNTKVPTVELKTTDKNGYFYFTPSKLTTAGIHKCKVFLHSSPSKACGVPTNLHAGAAGAILFRNRTAPVDSKSPFELFTVGPFAFDAAKKLPCHY